MIGARAAEPGPLHRLIARATARHLLAFVVPGVEVARAAGLDLEAAGLLTVPTPRRANVLVLVTPTPEPMIEAAAVVYAQMPRPRSILSIGHLETGDLPAPDVTVDCDQVSLADGVERLRHVFAAGAWQPAPEPFRHDSLEQDEDGEGGSMAHHHHHHGGSDDEGHHEHQEQETHAGHGGHGEQESSEHEGHEGHGGHDMDHGDHGDGFMSMIAMTQDLPRSPDKLQMDWLGVPFGPLHPGLPGGLNLTLTLDGDRIAGAEVGPAATESHLGPLTPAPVTDFATRLASLDRLAPGVYRILAERALAALEAAPAPGMRSVLDLERSRLTSHLGWLASFGYALGYRWLRDEAAALQCDSMAAADVESVRPRVEWLRRRLTGSFLLRRRLKGFGRLDPADHPGARGPVARAMGRPVDARCDDPAYRALGFTPVVHEAGDALARLNVRLEEILQSIDLISAASGAGDGPRAPDGTGATIETPRGSATMHLTVEAGRVIDLHLDTPSPSHTLLIPAVAGGLELGAGLVAIASLDISPWEDGQ